MKKGVVLLFILLIPFVSSASQVNYKIYEKNVFVQVNHQNNTLMQLPLEYSSINSTTEYFVKEGYLYAYGNGTVSYFTKSLIESHQKDFFVVSNKENVGAAVSVQLPEGASLSEKYFPYPSGYSLKTDGKTITLVWNKMDQKEIFVPYDLKKERYLLYGGIFILLVFAGIYFGYSNLKKKEKFTRNLVRSERKVMEILLKEKNKSLWTKNIVKESGLSKVKLSRTLRKLEEKGLIEKIPYGNENLIKIKK